MLLENRSLSSAIAPRRSDMAALARRTLRLLGEKASPYWLLAALSLAGTVWNGPLVLSFGVGLAVRQQLMQLTPEDWRQLAQRFHRHWRVPSPQLRAWLLSMAAFTATYGVTALWSEAHELGLALALGGQSVIALALMALLLRPAADLSEPSAPQAQPLPAQPLPLEAQLYELVNADPLKRLIGVRQVLRLALQDPSASYLTGGTSMRSHLLDCLHLMLAQENEPIVRSAIREGLDLLREKPQLSAGAPAVATPMRRPATSKVRRSVVEYVEP